MSDYYNKQRSGNNAKEVVMESYRQRAKPIQAAKARLASKFCYKNACVWGRWEGNVRYCPFARCWKVRRNKNEI
ncbi:MAG: hypothetical protein LBE55_01440 [Clostridiales bacterium]|jgi:hypothetical protein|nr:hypothetical protein [Clostridiales bacterium]